MISKDEIKKLAVLARISINEEEISRFQNDLDKILDFISKIKEIELPPEIAEKQSNHIFNVFREDKEPHKPLEYTESLLKEAPEKENDFIKVKKILNG
ncbi:MAG: Asp-tRNA(Asn)/Glu-tRNA(Gln) amidotransferase subunit GatC [bacterium]|nr:Asp-tRNA(Asn)/Glu-tRNA(Gln) amidotransferase subunit GatC [bacterium]